MNIPSDAISYISIIIPVYNAALTIINTLESVRNQIFKGNIEIIIINDGSTDNSLDLVTQYKTEHRELNIQIINKINGGAASARNVGIKAANREFIALLDSDDIWLPNKLKTIMPYFANKDINCIGSSRNGRILKCGFKTIKKLTRIYPHDLVFRSNLATPTVVFRKSIVEMTGLYNENMRYGEDVEYWLRIAHNVGFYVIPNSLVITGGGKHDFGESGLSSNLKEMHIGELKAIYSAYVIEAISGVTYNLAQIFARLKYVRRVIVVKLRKLKSKY
jgi:glycosyltransferase involved in cell wall biosynthesis